MSGLLEWAAIERGFVQQDIDWFKSGAKLISPSGEDITASKMGELELRLEHANKVIAEETGIDGD